MVRVWREIGSVDGGVATANWLVFWAALVSLCLVSAIVFSCADGVSSKEKNTAGDTELYGGGCAVECGAACGA
ncbi:unnamed protein product [Prunus brigantina]